MLAVHMNIVQCQMMKMATTLEGNGGIRALLSLNSFISLTKANVGERWVKNNQHHHVFLLHQIFLWIAIHHRLQNAGNFEASFIKINSKLIKGKYSNEYAK